MTIPQPEATEEKTGRRTFDPKLMTLGEHLTELRGRLVKSLWALVAIFLASFAFAKDILIYLQQPLLQALPPEHNTLHFTGPMDVFFANIKVAFLAAIVMGAPVWIYQLWRFIEPALYPKERKYVMPFMLATLILFGAGVSFCFFIMLPMALEYLITMGLEVGTPIITVPDYLSLVLLLLFAFGVMFETPVILILLAMLGLIDDEMLRKNRRITFLIIVVVAAILTPTPDPVSQLALAGPTYLMYEIAILIIRFIKRGDKKTKALEPT